MTPAGLRQNESNGVARIKPSMGFGQAKPENLPEGKAEEIQHLAKRVYRALGLSGYARIDVRMDAAGQVYVLEANPNPTNCARRRLCGFGRESRLYLSRVVARTTAHRASQAAGQLTPKETVTIAQRERYTLGQE